MTSIPGSPLRALLEASANSPLGEADPASLDELMRRVQTTFNKRPLEKNPDGTYVLTDSDIAANVLYFRHQRAKFSALAKQKELSDGEKPRRSRSTRSAGLSEDAIKQINEAI